MTSHEHDTNWSKKERGLPRMSWQSTFNKDLKIMGVTWEEVTQRTRSSGSALLPDVPVV